MKKQSTTSKSSALSRLFRSGIKSIACFAAALALFSTASTSFAQTIWTDGTGNWFTPGNWSAGVPNSTTDAQTNNGGTAQIFSGGAAAQNLTLGLNATDSGNLSIDGSGNLTLSQFFLTIGSSGTGTFSITNGGTYSGSSAQGLIGRNSGSAGSMTVDGSGSQWSGERLIVGFSGAGTLNVTNGGTVSGFELGDIGEIAGSIGTATVDGPGSTWFTQGAVSVGPNGTGTLNITNGGAVTSGGANIAALNPGSTGMVTVEGAGSIWNSVGLSAVGSQGTGVLTIINGGMVSLSGGASTSIGGSLGSTGTVTVDGAGSSWNYFSGSLFVGGSSSGSGGVGLLRIENGGTVSATATTVWNTGALEIGVNPILNSALTFDGATLRTIANTTFIHDASLAAGGVIIDSKNFTSILGGVYSGAGALTKVGTGTLSLIGANTYTGSTAIKRGQLEVNNTSGSATGTGAVQVRAGKLGGRGKIAGTVTVGIGSGSGASLMPGTSAPTRGVLTIQSKLTFKADGTHIFQLRTSGNNPGGDKVFANGVTINSGALFSFIALGTGTLTPGTVFTVIDNPAATAIAGTFSNLPDDSTFTVGSNTFQADYQGGTGNDLTVQ